MQDKDTDEIARQAWHKAREINARYKEFCKANNLAYPVERVKIFKDQDPALFVDRLKNKVNLSKREQVVINNLTNGDKSVILSSLEIQVGRSVGAKAKNYDIELPNKEIVHLTEGSRVTNIETIAGKGRNRQIDEIYTLVERYGGSASEWQKKKGLGYVDYEGESYRARLHWYEEPTVGKCKWKVKPDADGNWFIEDD